MLSFLFLLSLINFLSILLGLFNTILADVLLLFLLELREFAHFLLLRNYFTEAFKLLLLLSLGEFSILHILDALNLLICRLCRSFYVLILIGMSSLLANLEFDFEGVKGFDDLLISHHLVLLLFHLGHVLLFNELALLLPSPAILTVLSPHSSLLYLCHVSLVSLHRLQFLLSLIFPNLLDGFLVLLVHEISLVLPHFSIIVQLLLHSLLFLHPLLELCLKPVKIFTHLAVNIELTSLQFLVRASKTS